MSTGDQGLGGPLKKPAAKGLDGKPLAGKSLAAPAAKPMGEAAPAPSAPAAPVAPSAPAAPLAFEFDDAPAPQKKSEKAAPAASSFNPFGDQPVAVNSPAAVPPSAEKTGTGRVEKPGTSSAQKPGTGRIEKPNPGTGRIEKPGTGKATKPTVSDPMIGDIAPGLAKDLWTCPHCGAKNKPNRESCRECKKLATDPVEKPWYMEPKIAGPIAGGLVVLVLLIMWLTSVDLSLHPAGTVDSKVRSASITYEELEVGDNRHFSVKKTAAVSGRVITTADYAVAPWLTAVVLALGSQANDDAAFSTWSAEFDGDGYVVKAPRYATLFLFSSDSKVVVKAGDYLSVVGKAGVAEQDHTIVKGTELANCWTIKVEQIETK